LSTIKATTLSNLAGSKTVPTDTVVDGSAKAWVNFNGTGTVAIRRAFNVLSITDNGTGDYTVNFTNAMVDGNYGVAVCGTFSASGTSRDQNINIKNNSAPTTTSIRIQAFEPNTGGVDTLYSNVAIFS